jgi:hypothetical protein
MQPSPHTQSFTSGDKTPKTKAAQDALPQGVFSETWDYTEEESLSPDFFSFNRL